MDVVDLVVGQAERVVGAEILMIFVDVVLVQAPEGGDPDVPVGVFGEGVYFLVGECVGDYDAACFAEVPVLRPAGRMTGGQAEKDG